MKPISQRRIGFTLLEVTVASALTVSLAVMLGTTWRQLSSPMSDLIVWGQLFQEMDIAVAALARDLGGSLPEYKNADMSVGENGQGLLIASRASADGTRLQLCFDGGSHPDGIADWGQPNNGAPANDTVVEYYVDGTSHALIRSNTTNSITTSFTVAKRVNTMTVTAGADSTTLQIQLTFNYVFPNNYRDPVTRQCTLITKTSP